MTGKNQPPVRVVLYSSNSLTRENVRLAVGRRAAADLPVIEWHEAATEWAVLGELDTGQVDLLIADGESQPCGGLGVCRQVKNEVYKCPPVLVLTGRPQDAWLAAWSQADAAVPHPLDPLEVSRAVEELVRARVEARVTGAVDVLS